MGDDLEERAHGVECPCGACAPQTEAMRLTEAAREWLDWNWPVDVFETKVPLLAALLRAVAAEEREACARECEATMPSLTGVGGIGPDGPFSQTFTEPNYVSAACARRIRARGGR